MRCCAIIALCVLSLLACATPGPPPRARVSVEVLHGFPAGPRVPQPSASARERTIILLDVATAPPEGDDTPQRAARAAANRLREALEPDRAVELWTLERRDEGCLPTPPKAAEGAVELAPLREEPPQPLARAFEKIAEGLEHPGGVGAFKSRVAHRVALFSVFGGCREDLCGAAARLVEAGARLDVALFGDASAPTCLGEAVPSDAPINSVGGDRERAAARFWVESVSDEIAAQGALAAGRADGASRTLPAGRVYISVELDRPLRVGPIELAPDTETRLRVLDFPGLEPPVREWSWHSHAIPPLSNQGTPAAP